MCFYAAAKVIVCLPPDDETQVPALCIRLAYRCMYIHCMRMGSEHISSNQLKTIMRNRLRCTLNLLKLQREMNLHGIMDSQYLRRMTLSL